MTVASKFVHALLVTLLLLAGSSPVAADCPALLNHTFPRLQDSAPLSLYRTPGEVIPELGTASFRAPYQRLESVHDKYMEIGLVTQIERLLTAKP
jgi:glutathione peroxidase